MKSFKNDQKKELNEKTKNNLKKVLKYNFNISFKNTKIFIWILISISLPLFKFNLINETNLKFIIEKDKYIDNCTKDDIYKYEYNKTCYISCPKDTYISLNNKYLCERNENISNKEYRYNSFNYLKFNYKQKKIRILDDNNDDEVDNIRNKIKNGEFNSIINDINKEYIDIKNNIIYQVTTLDYLYNKKDTNTSSVNLGECENKIKKHYNINEDTKLIIFKIDYYREGSLVPIVEYEIYNSNTSEKLDLKSCSNIAIEIYTPVSADINKEICITLCDDKCEYLNYDSINKMYGCKCEVKNEMHLISEIKIQEWNSIEYFNKHCTIIDNNDSKNKDDIINKIKNELKDEDFDSLISDVINGNDFIIKKEDVIFQITTSENQANNRNNNISNINLGECENLLREYYNIKEDEQLLIFKSVLSKEGALMPTVEYEVYDINKNKLNLSICKDIKIDIEIPVFIDESDFYKYDLSSEYYKDICYIYTSESGTDITLEDRKKEFFYNNFSLCEDNCEIEGYNSETKKVKCQCQAKSEVSFMSDNYDNKDQLLEDFNDIKENTNIFKCVKLFFSKEGLKSNIGSYIILVIIGLNIPLIIFFSFRGTIIIQNKMDKLLKEGNSIIVNSNDCNNYNNNMNYNNYYNMNNNFNMNMNNINNLNNYNNVNINNNNMNNYNDNMNNYNDNVNNYNDNMNNYNDNMNNNNINLNNDNNRNNKNTIDINQNVQSKPKRKKKRQLSTKKNNNNQQENNNPPKKIKKKKKISSQNNEFKENISSNYKNDSKIDFKNNFNSNIKENKINFDNNNNFNNNMQNMNKNLDIQKFNDYELNYLNYYDALYFDKRTFFQYYFFLIKRKNIFIFSFIICNDYNIREMKISLFFLFISLLCLINSLLINDSTIHLIYSEKGKFIFAYQLPQIIYSLIFASIIIWPMKLLFLSEKNMLEIKRVREQEQLNGKMHKIINIIRCKTISYFITDFILKFFCWFYVGLFCAVFKNTQKYLIITVVISFAFSLVFPFIYSLIPAVFRLAVLKAKTQRDRTSSYNFSRSLFI